MRFAALLFLFVSYSSVRADEEDHQPLRYPLSYTGEYYSLDGSKLWVSTYSAYRTPTKHKQGRLKTFWWGYWENGIWFERNYWYNNFDDGTSKDWQWDEEEEEWYRYYN